MKIVIAIPSAQCGGSEASMIKLASDLKDFGHDVTMVFASASNKEHFFSVRSDINVYHSDLVNPKGIPGIRLIKSFFRLRKLYKTLAPELIIACPDKMYIATLVSCVNLKYPIIISRRTTKGMEPMSWIWKILERLYLGNCSAIVGVCNQSITKEERQLGWRASVIPGPIDISKSDSQLDLLQRQKRIVALGRLSPEKGFDNLIKSFSLISDQIPDWSLHIYGEGTEREKLENLISGLKLMNSVFLPGATKDPIAQLNQAQIFALTSKFEGFPRALIQAMQCGLAVVSFACPGAPTEIIQDGFNGHLIEAENIKLFSDKLLDLCTAPKKRTDISSQAYSIDTQLKLNDCSKKWEELIQKVISDPSKLRDL